MKPADQPPLELRHYRYFAVLAEHMHFAKAAEELGISQPALSQQLRVIEKSVGAPLLDRSKRKVELTDVGEVLRDQARAVLLRAEQARQATEQAAGGNSGRIHIAYVSSASLSGVMPKLVHEFRMAHPCVEIILRELDMLEQLRLLATGAVDIGFIRPPVPEMPEGLLALPLLVEPMVLALHVTHREASQRRIDLSEFRNDTFICTHRRPGVGFYEITMALCQEAGFVPRTEVFSSQTSILISMVAAGFGVALVPASARSFAPPDVVFVPLSRNTIKTTLALASARRNKSRAVRAFIAMASIQGRHKS